MNRAPRSAVKRKITYLVPFSLFPRSIQILVCNRPKASDKIWKHLKELGLFKNMILNNLETEHFWVHLNKRKRIFKKFLERVISIHDNHYCVSFGANVICVFENQEYILSSSTKNLQAKTPFIIYNIENEQGLSCAAYLSVGNDNYRWGWSC